MTVSGSAAGRSILLIATITGIRIALASSMTSTVCGWTDSIAEMTKIMMSVTLAPLTLRLLKASWPGVSIKVTSCSESVMKVKAPID